jgi:hypothetical protein
VDRRPVRFSSAWSVGRVLATVFGSPDFIPAVYLKRGADIHRWTEHYDLGQVYRPEEDLAGWCDAYKAFTYAHAPSWHDNGIETVFETGVYHGVIDRIGFLKGFGESVCDIKTGKPNPKKDSLQLAAYTQGFFPETYDSIDRVGIYIAKDGTYKVRQYDDNEDFQRWKEILHHAIT